ncbi:50S ribosomal protein L30 [Hydrogenobacter hydrogenophilus]|uniref:Large ribosomal subunit protein uL30 n=1 Tax=Hydrogenobacter hydrogenophilus TaxID=35835 RepID=A0A285P6X2_9AQUI|nr:50S ribosomal protein L30 [Hydrogenobacter hydrogenophilus]SNZ16933.1 large subunit ribosomal protein L30 [Hydrogenobacter hydrogenophilus]
MRGEGMIKVTLVRGLAGKPEPHIQAVKSLGLKRVGQSRLLPDTPVVWGNIKKAFYLLKVEQV